ncbi:MAG: helix-turn-helix transcriptional regulator [Saprospiraceae bacterium]|nr:helix-turn-helix transcriptional regulator [Saprospiraceae bacterium]
MNYTFRCDCPITSAIDILGDKWMLVIVKQMLLENKWTFKDFTESDEAIATNILSSKLKLLEELGILTKTKFPNNKKTNLYYLNEMGLSLAPIIIELTLWSDKNLRGLNKILRTGEALEQIKANKEAFIHQLQQSYRDRLADILS